LIFASLGEGADSMELSNVEKQTRSDMATQRHIQGQVCCIAGMHRSGTSMVANLLHECGVFLGPEDELKLSSRHNIGGHFENSQFVSLNDDILRKLGGTWHNPPRSDAGWEFNGKASGLVFRARDLVTKFQRQYWGWKDPRSSLTLPFWLRVFPDLKVLVCVRNPAEVARSLFLRGDSRNAPPFQLWTTYCRQLLSATRPEQRLITHYESYFEDPAGELRRILDWLGIPASDETVNHACTQVAVERRHHQIPLKELLAAGVPDAALGIYFSLCAEAGPVYERVRQMGATKRAEPSEALAAEVSRLRDELSHLRAFNNEILDSRSFKLVSLWWRMRRPRSDQEFGKKRRRGQLRTPMSVSGA